MDKFPKPEQFNNPEKKQESIPSSEEVLSLFEKLLEGKEFEEMRKREDEQGFICGTLKFMERMGILSICI
jgi:hypothetical protein